MSGPDPGEHWPHERRLAVEHLTAIAAADGQPILRDVSLDIAVGVVGESGAGKSTIAKAILGIVPSQVKITAGRIDFEGSDLLRLAPNDLRDVLGRDIALIPQDPLTALNPARRIEGLDVSTQAQVLRLLRELQREMHLALAFISHDLSVIRSICDRVVVKKAGRIVEEGVCAQVFAAPQAPYTRALIDAIPLPVLDPNWLARTAFEEATAN